MVSLRKSAPKSAMFYEGERVLCFEPDPNKARVLYCSKILKIIETISRDGCNRSTEYSVHFLGWRRKYDRIVTEENLLKDTPSNRALQRQLQQELAEQAVRLKGKKPKKIPIIKEVISSLNEQDQSTKDSFEQTSIDVFNSGEDSSNSTFYMTNSNSATNEHTNQIIPTNSAVSALPNQTSIYTTNNQVVSHLNQQTNDSHNKELCQQIAANLDNYTEFKKLLEIDEQLICTDKILYNLPIQSEYSVHRILNEYEKFSLRMINTSNEAKLRLKSNYQLDMINDNKIEHNERKDQSTNQLNNEQASNLINKSTNNNQITRTSNRLNNQLTNQANNQINQQKNQSNQVNQVNTNFISNNSSGSSSSLNCLNIGNKQLKDSIISPTNTFTSQTIREFTNSTEIYFNALCDKMYLFYTDKEGAQYQQLKKSSNYLKPIHMFGFIHLLRLIFSLPEFFSYSTIPYKQLKQLIFLLEHFCSYLLDNQTKFTS